MCVRRFYRWLKGMLLLFLFLFFACADLSIQMSEEVFIF